MSTSHHEFLSANDHYQHGFDQGGLEAAPGRRVAVVTCMDARIDIYRALGLGAGDAHVIRNAGGVITDDVVRSLAISQHKLGTVEIAVIHHTKCGMENLNEGDFLAELEAHCGQRPSWSIGGFADVADDVRESVAVLAASPFLANTGAIRGYVYDVDTGAIVVVDGAGSTQPD